jgi:hypothetical protein
MWPLHEHERETWAVCCEEGGRSRLQEQQGREVTCMAWLVACRDAMAAGRGSGRVIGVRALWTIVRQTEDADAFRGFPLSSGLRLHASIG